MTDMKRMVVLMMMTMMAVLVALAGCSPVPAGKDCAPFALTAEYRENPTRRGHAPLSACKIRPSERIGLCVLDNKG